jgi:hypothetical protein
MKKFSAGMRDLIRISLAMFLGLTVLLASGGSFSANAASITVFNTDFNSGVPSEFGGITTIEGVQGFVDLGTGQNVFGGNFLRNNSGDNLGGGSPPVNTTLTLTGLPPHTHISLSFLLAIIDSWDGAACTQGPDFFNVSVDGFVIFSKVFENGGCGLQTYVPPAGVQLARHMDLGFTPAGPDNFYLDSAYNMGMDPAFNNIPHTANTLTIKWFASGNGWQGGTDESWAIDNVQVIIPPPLVKSIERASPEFSSASSVDFTITFSESVTGVTLDDFVLTTTGVVGATITNVSGSGAIYTVTVNTGSRNGTIRLDVVDDNSILNGAGNPLGGAGLGDGNFSFGEVYTIQKIKTFRSIGSADGWILSRPGENKGTRNSTATTILLGDNKANKQYRSILSFKTAALPDNAIITKITLRLRRVSISPVGTNPINLFQGIMVDVRKGFFGSAASLQSPDFNAAPTQTIGPFKPPLQVNINLNLTAAAPAINLLSTQAGVTQFRLRFKRITNNDAVANLLVLASGNTTVSSRPQLIVEYHTP